jgi:transposase-like protein
MSDINPQDPALSSLLPAQAKVVLALAQGATISKAAHNAGVHRSTVHDWLKNNPQFAAALRQARREYVATLRDELKELSALALSTLRSLLEDTASPSSVRLRCALALLQRPQYPAVTWSLPESVNSAREDSIQRDLAFIKAEMETGIFHSSLPFPIEEEEDEPDLTENVASASGGG